ncbi:MAG: hypothetical protein WBV25_11770 [Methylocella sp.]
MADPPRYLAPDNYETGDIPLDEFLHDIEERLADYRARLEPLESGELRTDATEPLILGLKLEIARYESVAAKVRAGL